MNFAQHTVHAPMKLLRQLRRAAVERRLNDDPAIAAAERAALIREQMEDHAATRPAVVLGQGDYRREYLNGPMPEGGAR